MLERFGEPWLFGVPDGGIGDLVGKHGLELVSNLRIRELWNRYLRPGTADAVLGDADPEGGVAVARVPARQVTDRVVTAKARPPRPAEARVAPVDEPWTVEQRDYLERHQRADRLFNVFKTAAHHPELARSFDAFAFGYINSESLTLSPRDRELVILRIGWLCRAEYAWAAHSRIARSVGITEEELVRITRGPDAAEWRPFEAILLRAVDELHRDSFITDATWNALVERYDTRNSWTSFSPSAPTARSRCF